MAVVLVDAAQPGKIEKLESGMIRVRGRVARTGLQSYAPWPGAPVQDRMIRVYRPPGQVFADSSLNTLKGVPVTINHPPERTVTADNWKKYAVGHNEGEHTRVQDGGEEWIETSLLISDAEAVKSVEGKENVEISQGYNVELDWTAGVTDSGEAYDAVQTAIVHNHTAILKAGDARAGKGARVLVDSNHEAQMKKEEFQKLLAKALDSVEKSKRSAVEQVATDTIVPMLDSLDAKGVSSLVDSIAKSVTKVADEYEEEEKKEEEDEEEEKKEEEKKKEEDSGAELVKALADSKASTLAIIDAREKVRPMVGANYDFEGKGVKQLHLDAIAAKQPKLLDSLKGASDDMIRGAFEALRANKTAWVSTDSKERVEAPEHRVNYNKRMNDAFDATWSN